MKIRKNTFLFGNILIQISNISSVNLGKVHYPIHSAFIIVFIIMYFISLLICPVFIFPDFTYNDFNNSLYSDFGYNDSVDYYNTPNTDSASFFIILCFVFCIPLFFIYISTFFICRWIYKNWISSTYALTIEKNSGNLFFLTSKNTNFIKRIVVTLNKIISEQIESNININASNYTITDIDNSVINLGKISDSVVQSIT